MDTDKIVEKYANMRVQVIQCDLCERDYADAHKFEPCLMRGGQPHAWVERSHLLSREEMLFRAIEEATAPTTTP